MAIDTAEKRSGMLNFGDVAAVLPTPDGAIAAGDRWQLLGQYYWGAYMPSIEFYLRLTVNVEQSLNLTAELS